MKRCKKFVKLLSGIMLMGIIVITSSGCKKNENVAVDVKQLGTNLVTEITYEDELSEIDLDTAKNIYEVEEAEITDYSIYVSSGATAEEIAVIGCKDSNSVKIVEEAFETRVENQKTSFQDYVPEELKKLDKAVIIKKGNYVVFSVSNDDTKAKDIINNSLK
ncbi:hypothetical protein acsn021_35320 [Anaerocolumna cellulosilytica]|uniref:Uncharacterized protein n=1 Tax=Anaerocolumna cellulosilytica TaxID=433286 RepID=A0A6S6QXM9_9FIRM|nr:DUF4358 domain-containing protein [Anaerocolumna cellulosilytica]MBB5195431.1 hypothetical protein [Anaerocolumna cellulosilytica]BCJ95963.1 hypothetical protein acsn021_35320 [Anaerocolumna cellulosilytica]